VIAFLQRFVAGLVLLVRRAVGVIAILGIAGVFVIRRRVFIMMTVGFFVSVMILDLCPFLLVVIRLGLFFPTDLAVRAILVI
jgi:hypothetical protein